MENESEIDHLKQNEVLYARLEESLNRLKPEQQQCMRLFYLEDKSYLQITELTGFDLKKVKSYIQNGKRNLQLLMNQYDDNQKALWNPMHDMTTKEDDYNMGFHVFGIGMLF